jgi:O-antigen ligase
MQLIGGGGRPIFPLLACYLPVLASGLLAIMLIVTRSLSASTSTSRAYSHDQGGIPLLAALAVGLYLLIRTCFGGDPGLREYELLRLAGVLAVYLVMACAVCSRGPRLLFLSLMMASAFVQAGIEFYQFFCVAFWSPIREAFPWLVFHYPFTVGTYANKNHLAWLMGDAALFALALCCWGRCRWTTRGLLLYCFMFFSAGVAMSLSRGGVVALGGGLVLFALLSLLILLASGNFRGLLVGSMAGLMLAVAGGVAVVLLSGNLAVQSRMQGLWMDTYREDLWRAAIHDLGVAPFLGLGAGSFQWSARLMMPYESLLAHNDFAQLLSEYGLVGALLLLVFLTVHFVFSARRLLQVHGDTLHGDGGAALWSDSRAILLGALAVAGAQVVHSFFDFNMHLAANALLAGACFGLLCNPFTQWSRGGCRSGAGWVRWTGALSLTALCALMLVVMERSWNREKGFFEAERLSKKLSATTGNTLESLKGVPEAVRHTQAALDEVPSSSRYAAVLFDLQWRRFLCSDPTLAEPGVTLDLKRRLSRVVALDPGDWFARMCLGDVLARLGDETGARNAFLGAMQRLPLFALVYEEYGLALEGFGEEAEAEHYYRVASRFQGAVDLRQRLQRLESRKKER